jgi:hypothetical protein
MIKKRVENITLFSRVTKLDGGHNMLCKVLESYLMNTYLNIFNMINLVEALLILIARPHILVWATKVEIP